MATMTKMEVEQKLATLMLGRELADSDIGSHAAGPAIAKAGRVLDDEFIDQLKRSLEPIVVYGDKGKVVKLNFV